MSTKTHPKTYKLSATSYVLHLDGDSFFVACEMTKFPYLKGKAVIVGEERGIATAMSTEAKKLGVTRGMPVFKVKKLYPEVVILPSHFELYQMYSERMVTILKRFSRRVEEYSIDECFAILNAKSWNEAEKIAKKIKETLQSELGITFSLGVARTKVLAKIGSNAQKPDGFSVIHPEKEDEYLLKTPIGKIWGIGYRSAPKFIARGIKTALDFKNQNEDDLDSYSEPFRDLWNEINGRRKLEINDSSEDQKSLQSTRTFSPVSSDKKIVLSELSKNIEIACARARRAELYTNHIYIFLKNTDFRYTSTEIKLPTYTQNPSDIMKYVEFEFSKIMKKNIKYRSTGITLQNLRRKDSFSEDLFGMQRNVFLKEPILKAVDILRETYGTNILFLGASMKAFIKQKKDAVLRNTTDTYIYDLPFPYLGEVA